MKTKLFLGLALIALVFLLGCAQEQKPAQNTQGNNNLAPEQWQDSEQGQDIAPPQLPETGAGDAGNPPAAGPETRGTNGTGTANGRGGELTQGQPVPGSNAPDTIVAKEYTVEITDTGYSPQKVTVKQGDTVKWVNNSSSENWPASAKHPTHEVYPGSSITKCGTAEESNIFDACRGLKAGESYSFTFNEKGMWAYHEHIAVKMFGQVVVE